MSTVLDRTTPPPLAELQAPTFPEPLQHLLSNGLPVHLVPFGAQPVVELQLVVAGGKLAEAQPAAAGVALRMLQEGTANYTAGAFAEALDAIGASLQLQAGLYTCTLRLSLLTRHLPAGLRLLQELILHPAFPEASWQRLQGQLLQQARIQQGRTQYHAQRAFYQGLFGGHPYGHIEQEEDLAALQLPHLRDYWQGWVRPMQGYIIVAGQFEPEAVTTALNDTLGILQRPRGGTLPAHPLPAPAVGQTHHTLPDAVQTTLLVGHRGPLRAETDHYPLRLLGVALGGYFGSRLMQHLREAKGYTYGVGGGFTAYRTAGYFGVRTDLDNRYLQPALAAIREEMTRIREAPLAPDELARAKRYLLGRHISGQETPFQVAAILKGQLVYGLTLDDYRAAFPTVAATTAEDLLALAQRHLHPEALWVASCGGGEA